MKEEIQEFERLTKFMIDGGLTKPEIKQLWKALASVGKEDPENAINNGEHGDLFVTDLADVLRAGDLTVMEVEGWQERCGETGGFANNRIEGISLHTTGESLLVDGKPVAFKMALESVNAPSCNLYVDRKGTWWVIAAGTSNASGRGGPWHFIPKDGANTRTLAIKCGNNEDGEPWTIEQQVSLEKGVAVLWNHFAKIYSWALNYWRIFGHYEYSPGRVKDPVGPAIWIRPKDKQEQWDMDKFRKDVIDKAIQLIKEEDTNEG